MSTSTVKADGRWAVSPAHAEPGTKLVLESAPAAPVNPDWLTQRAGGHRTV